MYSCLMRMKSRVGMQYAIGLEWITTPAFTSTEWCGV